MKRILGVLIVLTGVGCAQVRGNESSKAPEPDKELPRSQTVLLCHLESVSWDPATDELSWVISARDVTAPENQPPLRQKYTIHVDTAVMSVNGEGRHFDADEAKRVGTLMDLISTYTVESTAWWAKGLGEKITGGEDAPSPSKAPAKHGDDKPTPAPSPALKGQAVRVSFPLPETSQSAQSPQRPRN
jgi:hypothetical protein